MNEQQPAEQENPVTAVPRRQVLRSLLGVATGLAVMGGLAACGGGETNDGEDDDEDD